MTSQTRLRCGAVALAMLTVSAGSASAGELAADLQAGYFSMTATKSAEVLFDSSGGFFWGGAVRYSLDMGVYLSGSVRTFSKTGERVFVAGPTEPVSKLGFPLDLRITPYFLNLGYRFRQGSLIVPYGGIGGGITSFREESSVAGIAYDRSETKAGFNLVGGVEVGKGRFRFGGEVGWSTVPDAVGVAGVSEIYGEDNLGGWSVVGKLVIAFGTGRKVPDDLGPIP